MKILVIRLSSIGDIVLTTPVVRCLKNQLRAGTEIHYLTKASYSVLLNRNPYVDRVWELETNLSRTIDLLKKESFDLIVDLHNNLRTRRIKWSLGVPSKTINKLNFRKFLLTAFKINIMPPVHIVDRYLETVRHLGIQNDGQGLDYFSPTPVSGFPLEITSAIRSPFITLAIGGQHATKKMPVDKLKEVISHCPGNIAVLGGQEDAGNGAVLERAFPDRVINLAGKLSLDQSAGMIAMSEGLITHDTGMMHIGAALKVRIIAIWGNTVPGFGMFPYYGSDSNLDHYNFEVQGLKCRPCSKLGYDKCPKGHFRCMKDQDTRGIGLRATAFLR